MPVALAIGVVGLACAAAAAREAAGPHGATVPADIPRGGLYIPSEWLATVVAAVVLAILWLGDVIRPGSPERHSARDVSGHPAPIWLFAGIVVYFAAQLGSGLLYQVLHLIGLLPSREIARAAVVALGAYTVAGLTGMLMVHLLSPQGQNAGLRFRFVDVFVGIGWMLLVVPLLHAVSTIGAWVYLLVAGEAPPRIAHSALEQILENLGTPWAWIVMLGAVVGAPVYEELVYRVFLQSALLRAFKFRWAAVLLTAFIFAVSHRMGDQVPWHAIPTLFVLGTLMGLAYERTGRLAVPIAMHAAFNLGNIILAMYLPR